VRRAQFELPLDFRATFAVRISIAAQRTVTKVSSLWQNAWPGCPSRPRVFFCGLIHAESKIVRDFLSAAPQPQTARIFLKFGPAPTSRRCHSFPAAVLSRPLEDFVIASAETIAAPAANALTPADSARPARLVSLDVFRGATIAAMILVNDPGSWSHIYPPLEHAEWNGWTPTDLIFPFFLFIVGVSLTLSFASRLARGVTRGKLILHVIRRSALIFALGLFLNGFPEFDFSSLRIMGVLQRIALCYLAAGLLYLLTYQTDSAMGGSVRVRANLRVTAAVALALLVAYWALLTFAPVPG
jgi:hypothetical protein